MDYISREFISLPKENLKIGISWRLAMIENRLKGI